MAKRGPKPKDDEAALRAMADLIVSGAATRPKPGRGDSTTQTPRISEALRSPSQSQSNRVERLRKDRKAIRLAKRGRSEGITRAARLVVEDSKLLAREASREPSHSEGADIERLRKSYRVKRARLERDARRRRKIKIGRAYQADGLPALRRARETSLFAPSVYFKSHDAELTRKQAAKIAIIAETAVSIAAKTLIPAIRRSATSAELREGSEALAKVLETVMKALRDSGQV